MPKFYNALESKKQRKKATFAGSITYEPKEVHPTIQAAIRNSNEAYWDTMTTACNIGYTVTTGADAYGDSGTYIAKAYAQWDDMADAGMTLQVKGCKTPSEALVLLLSLLKDCKMRIDKITPTDVEF